MTDPVSGDDPESQGSDGSGGSTSGTPTQPGTCAMAAAPGSTLARIQLAPGAGGAVLAATAGGEVVYSSITVTGTMNNGAPAYTAGITKLDAQLSPVYEYPHGSVVALDAQGNAYVAGAFTAPTDFGAGVVEPMGNVDVFLAKLSPTGEVLSAMALGLCGDGLLGIAVDGQGRVAISGTAIGTVVVDATGGIVFQVGAAGKVAFDSHGNLIIGGAFTGSLDLGGGNILVAGAADDTDAFLVKLDAAGGVVFARRYGDAPLPVSVGGFNGFVEVTTPRDQAIADVAVGANDEIALVGEFRYEMDLLGQTLRASPEFPSGSEGGIFVVKLDASGAPVFNHGGGSLNSGLALGGLVIPTLLPGTAIAINAHGDVAVSSNTPSNAQGPNGYPQLSVFDGQTGVPYLTLGNETGPVGYGLGVAFDGCGDLIWATFTNEPSIFDPHTFITKVAR